MAKSSYYSVSYTPIKVEFEGYYELESLIDDLRELLETTDRGQFGHTASMYQELLEIRAQSLKDIEVSAASRRELVKYSDEYSVEKIINNRSKGEAA